MNINLLKYIIAFTGVLIVRLIPFRAPNLEPVLAVQMPFSKKYSKIASFLFGFLSITVYDLFTSGLGVWTIVTAVCYGLLGLWASYFFKNRSGWRNYALYAVMATILYDCLTGLTVGPIVFGQSFISALLGQIPFTAIHLLGNVSFAIVLSPIIEMWLQKESKKVIVSSSKVVLNS